MVIFKLLVYGSVKTWLYIAGKASVDQMYRIPEEDGGQPRLFKILHRLPHKTLKAQRQIDPHRGFAAQVLPGPAEAHQIPFCIGPCHGADLLLAEAVEKLRRPKLRLRHPLSVPVQVGKVRKIRLHQDPAGKAVRGLQAGLKVRLRKLAAVIVQIGIENILKLLRCRPIVRIRIFEFVI